MTFIQYDNKWQQQRVHFSNMVISHLRKTNASFYFSENKDIVIGCPCENWTKLLYPGDWIIIDNDGKFWKKLFYLTSTKLTEKIQG